MKLKRIKCSVYTVIYILSVHRRALYHCYLAPCVNEVCAKRFNTVYDLEYNIVQLCDIYCKCLVCTVVRYCELWKAHFI